MSEDVPFKILSATKIWLSREARDMAAANGMNEIQMARHLLNQNELRETGLIQREGEN